MNDADETRILMVGSDPIARSLVDRMLVRPISKTGAADGQETAPSSDHLPPDDRIDEVGTIGAAEERIRAAVRTKRPYRLAVVSLEETSGAGEVEAAGRLVDIDVSLPLLLSTASPAAEAAARSLPASQFLVAPRPWDPAVVRSWVAVQWDRRAARRELDRLRDELAESRSRLARALEDVEQVTRVKAEFLAKVSHEIRTPMNSILGFSRLLLREPLPDIQRERVGFICDAANSLMGLVENVLDFSRASKGAVTLAEEPLQVDALLREALVAGQSAALEKGLCIQFHVEEAVPARLTGDRRRFRQVLSNLVSNAVKFSERGTVHIRVAVDEESEDHVVLRVVVADTGVGIPEDRQAMIFESFCQADGSMTRRFGGLGLGLSLSKQLVDLMGGEIGFRSTPGQGSTFWFTVPLKRRRRETEEVSGDSCAMSRVFSWKAEGETSNRPGTYRILVAEDEYLNRALIELLLTRAGCFVDLAGDGREALEVLRWNRYDLVFMDIQMPRIDGLEAIRRIRRDELDARDGRHMRIVAVTAGAMPGDREKCLAAGADDYLPKPFTADALLEALQRQIPGFAPDAADRPAVPPEDAEAAHGERLLSECIARLEEALGQRNFRVLEQCARTLKDLAGRRDGSAVADHAMRLQLAARTHD
ncbi:MAG: response regulator, partial [Pirellulales bacterium]|nr:response regulator [Pirellulales bacterium]